jgi:hypothetical protein
MSPDSFDALTPLMLPVAPGDGPALSAAFNVLEGRREHSPAFQRWDPGQLIPR